MKPVRLIPVLALCLGLPSCSHDPYINAAQTRGAVGGTAVGAIIGKNSKGIGQGEAMIAGALIGALLSENKVREQRSSTRSYPRY